MSTPGTPSRFADGGNAEAGPSTPRSYHTPPETPTKSAKRRSWFGFGGLSLTTPTKDKVDAPRRLSFDQMMELGSRIVTDTPQRAQDGDVTEELTIDAQPAESPRRGKRRSKPAEDGEVMALQDLPRGGSVEQQRRSDGESRSSAETGTVEVCSYLMS